MHTSFDRPAHPGGGLMIRRALVLAGLLFLFGAPAAGAGERWVLWHETVTSFPSGWTGTHWLRQPGDGEPTAAFCDEDIRGMVRVWDGVHANGMTFRRTSWRRVDAENTGWVEWSLKALGLTKQVSSVTMVWRCLPAGIDPPHSVLGLPEQCDGCSPAWSKKQAR